MSLEGIALQLQENFETICCYSCKCLFAVPAALRRKLVETGDSFWCPNGHSQHYSESDVQKLRKQVERLERQKNWAETNAASERSAREHTERRLISQKGAATKLRNRIVNGVCPCCTRSFTNLREHMKHKHPDWQPPSGPNGSPEGR